jgi:TonB family protein
MMDQLHTARLNHSLVVLGVALLQVVGSLAQAQDKTPGALAPLLKKCSDKNPPPCVDKPPVLTHQPDPKYTKQAQKAKCEGTVVLGTVVGTDGVAHDIHIKQSLGYGLDEEAVKAVRKWRFKPAESAGQPTALKLISKWSSDSGEMGYLSKPMECRLPAGTECTIRHEQSYMPPRLAVSLCVRCKVRRTVKPLARDSSP